MCAVSSKPLQPIRLSGSVLKVVAIVAMLIDHIGFFLIQTTALKGELIGVGDFSVPLYKPLRWIGRLAFPLFCFLLVEGFLHTRNRRRYGRNLLLFALLSEIPWNLVHSSTLLCPKQNVLFTLFLGFMAMVSLERYRDIPAKLLGALVGIAVTAILLRADYGVWGVAFIALLYALHTNRTLQTAIGGLITLAHSLTGAFAFVLIHLYNGERGFIRGAAGKYFFYIFYPLHLLLLYIIKATW